MGRWYPHPKDPNKHLVSVTTFLSILNKPFLVPWAAKLERAARKKSGPYAYQDYMQEASDFGQEVHHAIERYVVEGKTSKVAKACIPALKAFVRWWSRAGIKVLDAEEVVSNLKLGYAGTLDIRFKSLKTIPGIRKKGQLYVGDWKTGKGIWPEHHLQNIAYRNCDGMVSDGGVLFHIPHDGSDIVEVPINPKATMKEVTAALHLWNWIEKNR